MNVNDEYSKLDRDLQIHSSMIIEIVKKINKLSKMKCDLKLITVCAVLHDSKNHEENHEKAGAEYARIILNKKGYAKPFVNKACNIISNHTKKPKTRDFTEKCFYDADILVRFNSLGILRAWANIKEGGKDIKKLFNEISDKKQLLNYYNKMKKRLQLTASKNIMTNLKEEYLLTHELLKNFIV